MEELSVPKTKQATLPSWKFRPVCWLNPLFFYLWVAFVEGCDAGDHSLAFEGKRAVCVDERLHLRQRLQHQQPLRPGRQSSVPHLCQLHYLSSLLLTS